MEESVCITNDPQEGTVAIIAKGFRQRERNPRQHTRARVADGDPLALIQTQMLNIEARNDFECYCETPVFAVF